MNLDLEQLIKTCQICQKYQNSNQREPLEDRPLPSRPWQYVALDFFHLNNVTYLLVTDYFSKFTEVQPMKTTSAKGLIFALKPILARFGLPDEIVSDNCPPFDSVEFKSFLVNWDIIHNPVAPYNPRSNGLAERTVQTLKKSLLKAFEEGKDLYTVLMDHRNTPSNGLKSPAELIMGRKIRTLTPILPSNLTPLYKVKHTHTQLKQNQEKQHIHGDLHTKVLKPLDVNDAVWLAHNKSWQPGTIIKVGPQKRSYTIKGTNGTTYKRNRFHLKPRTQSSQDLPTTSQSPNETVCDTYEYDLNEETDKPSQAAQLPTTPPRAGRVSARSNRVIYTPAKLKDYVR